MKFLPKQLQEEKFSYSSTKTKPDLMTDFQNILSEKWYDVSTNLSGEFTSENEFYITSKYGAFFSDSGSSGHNALKGKITDQNGKTVVDVVVKPVPRIYVFTFAPPLFGLAFLCSILFHSASIEPAPLLCCFALIVVVPLAALFYGQAAKDRLREKFADILKLTVR